MTTNPRTNKINTHSADIAADALLDGLDDLSEVPRRVRDTQLGVKV